MFNYFYLSTKDKKHHDHHYKLPAGEAAPDGHEITDLRVAGQVSIVDLVAPEQLAALKKAFPKARVPRAKKK